MRFVRIFGGDLEKRRDNRQAERDIWTERGKSYYVYPSKLFKCSSRDNRFERQLFMFGSQPGGMRGYTKPRAESILAAALG